MYTTFHSHEITAISKRQHQVPPLHLEKAECRAGLDFIQWDLIGLL